MSVITQPSLPAVLPIAERAALPPFPICRFTVAEYRRMIAAGIWTEDDHVELLKGWIVPKMPQNTPHKQAIPLIQMALTRVLPSNWYPAVQQPVGTGDSEPEPDFSVVRGHPRDYPDGTPTAPFVGLLVEAADSSLHEDRTVKAAVYAEAEFPVYWIVNLLDRRVEVYTDPTGPAEEPHYRQRHVYGEADAVPLVLDGHEVARIPVRDLLP